MTTPCCGCKSAATWPTWSRTWSPSRPAAGSTSSRSSRSRVIDGQADEESVAAAAMQAAVYILALQDLLTAESLPAAAVSTDAILVTPENFTRQATATFLDVRKQVSILRRQLARITRIDTLLDQLPPGLTFDLVPEPDGSPARPRGELAAALETVPARYQPRCLQDLRARRLLPRRSPRRGLPGGPRLGGPRRPRRPGRNPHRARAGRAAAASRPPTRPTSPAALRHARSLAKSWRAARHDPARPLSPAWRPPQPAVPGRSAGSGTAGWPGSPWSSSR